MSEVFLGIDAGTSAIKVCAFDRHGALLKKAQRAVPVITPYPLWVEIDLAHYWALLVEALREVTSEVGAVSSVGLSTTCPTTIFLDAHGVPLRHAIVYLDGRADEIVRTVVGDNATTFHSQSGNRASPSTCWAANSLWVQRNEPDVWKNTRHVGMLNSYIALKLTGELGIDPTQASYSGLMDVRKPVPQWDAALMDVWQMPSNRLPRIAAASHCIGRVLPEITLSTMLTTGVNVSLGVADTAAAAFGLQLSERGEAFESVGTSGVITFCLDAPDFDCGFLNRHHVYPNRWLAHGAMSTSGGAFGWLQNKIWPDLKSLAELERLAQASLPGANGLIFLPYLAGERSPIWDAQASGAWVGLRLNHTRADMVRAVFEGTAFGLRQIMLLAQKKWGLQPETMIGVGGGSHSRFWAQIKADVLNLNYGSTEFQDAGAFGAAMLGAVAGGFFSGLTDLSLPSIKTSSSWVKPSATGAREVYARQFEVFSTLYPALAPSMHALAPTMQDSRA